MKILLTLLISLFSTNAFSQDFNDQDILSILISESSNIAVFTVNDDGSEDYFNDLSYILATHFLSNDHVSAREGEEVNITNTALFCDEGSTAAGSFYITCELILGDGTYTAFRDGYEGPESESALILSFTVKYTNSTQETVILNNSVTASFAG